MAILINGNGNQAIYAAQDADWYASIFGGQTAITGVGYQFEASLLDANTIGVKDGVIITQEGRRIQIDANVIDTFDIPTGGQGETNYYIIGYHLVTGTQSEQTCETFVRLMENATDTIPEGTFRGGDDDIYISLYRVTQDDLVITDIDLLLPTVQTITELNNSISDLLDLQVEEVVCDTVEGSGRWLFGRIPDYTTRKIVSVTLTQHLYHIDSMYIDVDYSNQPLNGNILFRNSGVDSAWWQQGTDKAYCRVLTMPI